MAAGRWRPTGNAADWLGVGLMTWSCRGQRLDYLRRAPGWRMTVSGWWSGQRGAYLSSSGLYGGNDTGWSDAAEAAMTRAGAGAARCAGEPARAAGTGQDD